MDSTRSNELGEEDDRGDFIEEEEEEEDEEEKEHEEEEETTIKQQKRRIPLNYIAFVKDADEEFDSSSTEAIAEQLYAGVLFNKGKKKYWVDKDLHTNCFLLFPKTLDIANSEHGDKYWRWESVTETRKGGCAEIAILKEVCFFRVVGSFNTMFLTPGVVYEVVFVIKMERRNFGWNDIAANLEFQLPDESNKEETKRNLSELPIEQWIEILAGKFMMSTATVGMIQFCLYEHSGHWKGGLVLKGVAIKPIKE